MRDLTEEDMAKMFPALPPEDRAEAAYNFTEYIRVVARIFDDLVQEYRIPKSIIRAAEKRRKRMKRKGLL